MNTDKITLAVQEQLSLTEQDLIKLHSEKKGLVFDLSTDEGFKAAKKERQERNKTTKGIADLAIAGKKAVDVVRHELIARVEKSYTGIIQPLEVEDLRRKKLADEKAEKEKVRVEKIQSSIQSIKTMINQARGQDTQTISDIIEAVDLIDCADNFAELTQEALQTKNEVLGELNNMLTNAMNEERIEKERESLRQQKAEQDKKQKQADARELAQSRLNTLTMIPSTMFGKSSDKLAKKHFSITNTEINESEFGELTAQAKAAKAQVLMQLDQMQIQQAQYEEMQADKEDKEVAAPKVQQAPPEEAVATVADVIEPAKIHSRFTQEESKRVHDYFRDLHTDKIENLCYLFYKTNDHMFNESVSALQNDFNNR